MQIIHIGILFKYNKYTHGTYLIRDGQRRTLLVVEPKYDGSESIFVSHIGHYFYTRMCGIPHHFI